MIVVGNYYHLQWKNDMAPIVEKGVFHYIKAIQNLSVEGRLVL